MRDRNQERGFTLVELMIVVAIVGVLALVVIPSWMKETTKAKRRSEVSAMFAEIEVKQGAFKTERSYFLGLITNTPTFVGTTTCPAAVPTADYVFTTVCSIANSGWLALRIDPPQSSLRCQYSITSGLAGTSFTPPSGFKNSLGAVAAEPILASSWFYMLATCDERGNGGTNATYYKSSVDGKLQWQNEGT